MREKKRVISARRSVAGFMVVRRASIEKLEARLDKSIHKLESVIREVEHRTREIEALRRELKGRDERIAFLEQAVRNAIQGELDRLFGAMDVARRP